MRYDQYEIDHYSFAELDFGLSQYKLHHYLVIIVEDDSSIWRNLADT